MIQCNRCGRWFKESDSRTCDPCWEDMGQMQFWHDEDEEAAPLGPVDGRILRGMLDKGDWEDPRIERAESARSVGSDDWEERHPIESRFDQ